MFQHDFKNPAYSMINTTFSMFRAIAESDSEWQWARARATLAAHIKYNIGHGSIHEALLDFRLAAFKKNNSNNNSVNCGDFFADPVVERYISRAAGVLGNFDVRRDRKIVPQVKIVKQI